MWTAKTMLVCALALLARGADAQEVAPPRVRSHSPVVAAAIAEGVEHSKTFRTLIDAIEATDGLIYVDYGKCGNNRLACLHLSVVVSGPFRILRILVSPRIAPSCRLTGSIGHELQHSLEALSNPHITSWKEMFADFFQTSRTASGVFETEAARQIGERVETEVCAVR
jgi:hypothetical protein